MEPGSFGKTTTQKGALAEAAVREWCQARGWQILTTNFKRKVGEIDLIALEGNVLVVAEVRSRTSGPVWVSPLESVTEKKQYRIQRTVLRYLQETGVRAQSIRFDVFVWNGQRVQWLPRAWG